MRANLHRVINKIHQLIVLKIKETTKIMRVRIELKNIKTKEKTQ